MGTQTYWVKDEHGKRRRVPSVTTVLKYVGDKGGLMNWYFQGGKQAAELEADGGGPFRSIWDLPKSDAAIGTVTHAMIEAELAGEEFRGTLYPQPVIDAAAEAYDGWRRWKERRSLEVVASELALSSPTLHYGGTIDLVAKVDGALTLIDFKTGKAIYAEYILQVAAYAALWSEAHPDQPLEEVGFLRLSKTDGGIHQHFWPASSPTLMYAGQGFAAAMTVYDILGRKLKDAA